MADWNKMDSGRKKVKLYFSFKRKWSSVEVNSVCFYLFFERETATVPVDTNLVVVTIPVALPAI